MGQKFSNKSYFSWVFCVLFAVTGLTAQTSWITVDSVQYTSQNEVLTIGNNIYSASLSNGQLVVRKKDLTGPMFYPIASDASLSYGVEYFKLINLDGMPAVVFRDINGGVIVTRYNGTGFITVGNYAFLPNVSYGFSVAMNPANNDIYLASRSYNVNMNIDIYRFNGLNWTQVVTGFNPTLTSLDNPQIYIKTDRMYVAFREFNETPTSLMVYTSLLSGLSNGSLTAHPVSGQLLEIMDYMLVGEPDEMPYILTSDYYAADGIRLSRLTAGGTQDISVFPVSDFNQQLGAFVKNNEVEVHFSEYVSGMFYNYKSIRWNGVSWQSAAVNNIVSGDYVYDNSSAVTFNENHSITSYIRDVGGFQWGYVSLTNRKPVVITATPAPLCSGSQQVSLFSDLKIQDLDFDKVRITWVESSDYSVVSASTNIYVDTTLPQTPGQSIQEFEIFADFIGNAGTAILTLFITDGYEEIQYQVPVTVYNPPTISVPFSEFETCANADLFDLNPLVLPYEGEFVYKGSFLPDGLFNPAQHSGSPNDVVRFIYTDGNGCTADHFMTPIVYYPSEIMVSTTPTSCGDASGSAVLTIVEGSAPFDIYWSNGDRNVYTIDALSSGIYFANVVDGNNCLSVAAANVEASEIDVQVNVTNVVCAGDQTGSVSVTVSGPDAPYALLWSSGHSSSTVTGLAAGTYELWIRGNSGCETSRSIVIGQTEPITVAGWSAVEPECGTASGLLIPILFGGNQPYSYQWSTGQTVSSLSGLVAGIYGLTVTDQTGCSASFEYALNNMNAQQLTARVTQPSCGNNDGSIRVIPETFWSVQSVIWSNDVSGFTNAQLGTGGFTCELTDWAGCKTFRKWNLQGAKPMRNEICLLTVDSATTSNVIVWEKVQQTGISHYNIYRETSQAGVYAWISSVSADEISVFNDVVASPLHRSWRYKISAVSACGIEGPLSRQHKTMHLVTTPLADQQIRVSWDEYEGIEYGVFELYRHTDDEGWQLIETLGLEQTEYIDTPPSQTGLDYLIEIVPDEICTGARAQDYNSSRSNKANGIFNPGDGTGDPNNSIEELEQFGFAVFPNPSTGEFTLLEASGLTSRAVLYNAAGQQILEVEFTEMVHIDLSMHESGIYFLQVQTGTNVQYRKLVLSK
jgi:hypothetical protein